jgi:hypothetical protein
LIATKTQTLKGFALGGLSLSLSLILSQCMFLTFVLSHTAHFMYHRSWPCWLRVSSENAKVVTGEEMASFTSSRRRRSALGLPWCCALPITCAQEVVFAQPTHHQRTQP